MRRVLALLLLALWTAGIALGVHLWDDRRHPSSAAVACAVFRRALDAATQAAAAGNAQAVSDVLAHPIGRQDVFTDQDVATLNVAAAIADANGRRYPVV